MKRDIVTVPLNEEETLILASDNSGAIGEKREDTVSTSYNVVGYYSFRVAVMECMAARATPVSAVIHNFCGDEAWASLIQGVQQGIEELSLGELPITGSTESNFELRQSAIGMLVVGKRNNEVIDEFVFSSETKVAVIGSPLVGKEVTEKPCKVAPLSLFKRCCEQVEIETILPVGSKGILFELNQLFEEQTELLTEADVSGKLDVLKSAGPATCFIITYNRKIEGKIRAMTGELFHPLIIVGK